jgi:hypothetical protein
MLHTFEMPLYIQDKEIMVTVDFDYEPAEPQTRNEPGCNESVIISEVTVNGQLLPDWMHDLLSDNFESKAIEYIDAQREASEEAKNDYLIECAKSARMVA